MAPIGVATCIVLVILQSAVTQYLKFRGQKDVEVATEASRVIHFFFCSNNKPSRGFYLLPQIIKKAQMTL